MGAPCPHQYIIDKNFSARLLAEKREIACEWCGAVDSSLRLCLYSGCLQVGCGEGRADHSTFHNNQFPSHCITLNLTTLRSWCYMCEMEVTSSVMASLSIPPGQQQHLGGPISAPGVAVAQPITPSQSSAEEDDEEDESEEVKAKGLVGLRNLGLTCYMNSALQAMSNSVPLAQFMIECPAFLRNERKTPGLARPFQRLMLEMWHKKRPSFVMPSLLYHGFKQLYPMFRGYTQQDSQEFLRYFMDQLHEELREPRVISHEDEEREHEGQYKFTTRQDTICSSLSSTLVTRSAIWTTTVQEEEDLSTGSVSEREESQSEAEYETCDSGVSEQSSGSSDHHPSKRKKRQHVGMDIESGITLRSSNRSLLLPEHETSEFSDAVSDTTLLDSESAGGISSSASPQVHSSITSGLGSSKPSIASITSSYRGKVSSNTATNPNRRRKPPSHRSVISDIFDGTIVSSVQCLTCNTISSRKETFQDLSLPIPSSDQLSILQHSSVTQLQQVGATNSSSLHLAKASCDTATDGWMWWIWVWLRSWLWGPAVSLHHCLAAFFSADELKGDNMYSCEKCGKLRNGVKYSKVLQLPEVLIIHLKRFRHETMFSSKISQYVSFPLHGLDLTQFLHKDCASEVVTYDLYAIICHHGTAGGGHYTAYCQNWSNHRWYEFDDQYVTEVSPETVAKCEAYVLFYKKTSTEMTSRRQRTVELMQVSSREPSLMQFYISKQWVNKFNTFSEPGPIDNYDFLCPHGGVQPQKASYVGELVMLLNQGVWEYLHQVFGGGPACTRLYECVTCRAELDALSHRQNSELEMFFKLKKMFQEEEHPNIVAISMRWFRTWESFVRGREQEPPGPIDNSSICTNKTGQPMLKPGSDYAQISEEMWDFFHETYAGGPELSVMYGNPHGPTRRSDRGEGARQESQKSEQLQQGSRSLNTDNLPYGATCANRQRTVSAGEAMRIAPTHCLKMTDCEKLPQLCDGSPTDSEPADEKEDTKEGEINEQQSTPMEEMSSTNNCVIQKQTPGHKPSPHPLDNQ
ncbi:ubiquitin carboxyl-terminal hydrolase 20-like isoform X2 [Homarus americanus]|uniref:ubiquitin carboxyl-terminal hydrolase 20-like isoform X2 n=1 Tax=Homarus americanus TaxID=6706 RepID=UPI001C43BD83|nr:ubiquitin carboxyl-terminal hydrolase 20-like isoform X2 [Homarus americanus]